MDMRIGEVAAAAGVSPDTIRHYERKGLLGKIQREAGGYRIYDAAVLDRVRVIRGALAIGFTLDELARVFGRRQAGKPPCRSVRDLAASKLRALDEQIALLVAARDALSVTLQHWNERLDATPEGGFAHLLESLARERKNTP